MPTKVDITTSTLLRLILLLLGLWFLFLVRDIIVLLFLVLIIVAGLSPTVDRWAKTLTRPGAVISVFLLIFLFLTIIFSIILPPLVNQLQDFSVNLPNYAQSLSQSHDQGLFQQVAGVVKDNISQISSRLSDLGNLLFSKTVGVISGIVAVITVIVLTFYLLLEEEGLKKIYKGVLPKEQYLDLSETTRKIAMKLGAWLRGQLTLMLAVGALDTIGLLIVGNPYALSLGIWAGMTEAVPIVGPWIGAIPGIIVGLTQSPLQGLLTLIVYLVVQQIENGILVPRVMSKAVGLNPFIVILAILIGGKLYGLMGVVLAVPLAAAISVVAEDWHVIQQTFRRPHKTSA